MAEEVIARGLSAQVRALATTIREQQLAETATMSRVRNEVAGNAQPSAAPPDKHMNSAMERMMSSSGAALDAMFLGEMIPHHAAALPTAHRAKPHVNRPELAQIADDLYKSHARQLGLMQALRSSLAD